MINSEVLEWCEQNMHNMYPLADGMTGRSTSGILLPTSFLVDCQINVFVDSDDDNDYAFYVSAIDHVDNGFIVTFATATSGTADGSVCGTTQIIPDTVRSGDPIDDRTFEIVSNGNLSISGNVIIGTCIDMMSLGGLTFRPNATKIIPLRVNKYSTGLSHVTFRTTSGDVTLYNDFTIVAGDGVDIKVGNNVVEISRVPTEEETNSGITNINQAITFLQGLIGNPIRAINGLPPDTDGNIDIQGGDCIRLESAEAGLRMSNTCSSPCCSDATAADVKANLDRLQDAQNRLMSYYEVLTSNINAMQARLASMIAAKH